MGRQGVLRALGAIAAVGMATVGAATSPAGAATQPRETPTTATRATGTSAVTQAVAVSRAARPAAFRAGTGTVYLVAADRTDHAIAAGTLKYGQMLLVPGDCATVPSAVRAEVARLAPARVTAIGSTGAVCPSQLAAAAQGRSVRRIAGTNRFTDAVAIARVRATQGKISIAYVASVDSLAHAAALGQVKDGVVLWWSNRSDQRASLASAKSSLGLTSTAVVGPDSLVPDQPGMTTRIVGPDAQSTAALVARRAIPVPGPARTVAGRRAWISATVAGTALGAAAHPSPSFLVPSCAGLPEDIRMPIGAYAPATVTAIGTSSAPCAATLTAAATRPLGVETIPGRTVTVDTPMDPVELYGVGGVAPYTWRTATYAVPAASEDLAPGVTFADTGRFSGTPTWPGTWSTGVTPVDSTGEVIDYPNYIGDEPVFRLTVKPSPVPATGPALLRPRLGGDGGCGPQSSIACTQVLVDLRGVPAGTYTPRCTGWDPYWKSEFSRDGAPVTVRTGSETGVVACAVPSHATAVEVDLGLATSGKQLLG